jgi:hypothetical protein
MVTRLPAHLPPGKGPVIKLELGTRGNADKHRSYHSSQKRSRLRNREQTLNIGDKAAVFSRFSRRPLPQLDGTTWDSVPSICPSI